MANNVLELRGKRFVQAARNITGGGASMNSKKIVTTKEILRLQNKMEQIRNFWLQENRPFSGVLISVHYNKVVAKSNRIGGLLKGRESDLAVVGAKFNDTKTKHIITYYVRDKDLEKSIKSLQNAMGILNNKFNGQLNKAVFDDYKKMNSLSFNNSIMSKSLFKQVIADISYIDDFEIELASQQSRESIITLYDTKIETKSLLKKLGIEILPSRIIDDQTIFLNESELELLFEKAPYLVSMATTDLSELSPSDFNQVESQRKMFIPDPTIEPTIGVIDTLFDNRVYFSKWVDYIEMIGEDYPRDSDDYRHGTAVSSIIVDGPHLNPWLEDNCAC